MSLSNFAAELLEWAAANRERINRDHGESEWPEAELVRIASDPDELPEMREGAMAELVRRRHAKQ